MIAMLDLDAQPHNSRPFRLFRFVYLLCSLYKLMLIHDAFICSAEEHS